MIFSKDRYDYMLILCCYCCYRVLYECCYKIKQSNTKMFYFCFYSVFIHISISIKMIKKVQVNISPVQSNTVVSQNKNL